MELRLPEWRRCTWVCLTIFCLLLCLAFIATMSPSSVQYSQGAGCLNHSRDLRNRSHDFPKIIHQMWKTADIPTRWQHSHNACVSLNLGYRHMLWTDTMIEAFLRKHFQWFVSIYQAYDYNIERVDAARYFILYHYGGAYIDLDITCRISLDDIISTVPTKTTTILGATAPLGVTNSMIISKQNDPFMSALINHLVAAKGNYLLPYWSIMFSTGPLFVFSSYRQYHCQDSVSIIDVATYSTYFNHTHGSSWHTWDGPIMVWFDHHGALVAMVTLASIATVVIVRRYRLLARCSLRGSKSSV